MNRTRKRRNRRKRRYKNYKRGGWRPNLGGMTRKMGRGMSRMGHGMGSMAGKMGHGMGSMAGKMGHGMGSMAGKMGHGMSSAAMGMGHGMGAMAGKMGHGMSSMAGKMGHMGKFGKGAMGAAAGLGTAYAMNKAMGRSGFPSMGLPGSKFAPVLAAGCLMGGLSSGVGGMFGKVKNVASMGVSAMGKLNPMSLMLGYPTSLGSAASGGMKFLVKMVGIPLRGVLKLVKKLPMLLMMAGGFGGMGLLAGQNYFNWMAKMWKYLYNGWRSAPLVTWCEKWSDGTCRCRQELFVSKWDDKPVIEVIDKDGTIGEEETSPDQLDRQLQERDQEREQTQEKHEQEKNRIAVTAAQKAAQAASNVTEKYAKEAAAAKEKAVKLQTEADKLKQQTVTAGQLTGLAPGTPLGKQAALAQALAGGPGGSSGKPLDPAAMKAMTGMMSDPSNQKMMGSMMKKLGKMGGKSMLGGPAMAMLGPAALPLLAAGKLGKMAHKRGLGKAAMSKMKGKMGKFGGLMDGSGGKIGKFKKSLGKAKKLSNFGKDAKSLMSGGSYKHFLDIRPVLNMLLRVENKNGKLKWTIKKFITKKTRKYRKKKRRKTRGGWRYAHEVKAFTNETVRRAMESANHTQRAVKYANEAKKTRKQKSKGNQKTRKR